METSASGQCQEDDTLHILRTHLDAGQLFLREHEVTRTAASAGAEAAATRGGW